MIEGTTMSKMTKSLEKRDKILAAGFYSKNRTVALRTLLVIESCRLVALVLTIWQIVKERSTVRSM